MSKKIKLKLWIAIIIAVCVLSYCITTVAVSVFSKNKNGFLTFQGVEYNVENLGYVISEWKGNDGKSDGRQSLIQSSVTDLMNAKLNHKEGDDPIIYKSVICMSHGVSNKVTNTGIYNVKTVIDIDYDDSYKSVIMKTYNSNGKKQVASAANTANGRAIGAKLAYAIVQNEQYTENGTGSDQKYSKYKNQVILYLRQAISSSMISANNIFLGQDTKLDNIDGATPTDKDKNVTNTFKSNIEAITAFKGLKNVSDKDATERTTILTLNSVRYVRIGPFKVTYGGNPVSSVKINGNKATNVYFAKYDSSKTAEQMEKEYAKAATWNNDLSQIPNNAYFYLAIKKSELPTANGDYTLSLHQNGISYRRARALLLEINSGQQLAVVANGGAKATGEVKLTYTVEHKDKAELIIIKQDKMTEKKLSGVKLKVYGESSNGSGKGWVGSNGSLVTYENSSTFTTNKDGKVTITKIPPGKYYVYEIGTASGYDLENQRHYFSDSNDDKKVAGRADRDNAVYIASVTLARADSKTITKNQYPSPKLTVKKVDYDNTAEKLDGIKFGIYLNGHGWLVYDSKTQNFSYSNSTRTAFETGKSYCGIAAVKGQFTLKGLLVGDYKIMEIGTTDDYVLSEQPGYDSNDGKKFVRCGQTSYKAGYTTVYLSDGKTKYNFRRVKYANNTDNKNEYFDYIHLDCYESSSTKSNGDIYYGTNYATFVVKNKKSPKDTSLNIRKLDNDSNTEISGAKFKVLVKLTQDEKVGTTTFKKDTYAWIKDQNGGLTTDVTQALELNTDNGSAHVEKIPYGKYYVYETKAAQGYTLEHQPGYNSGKPSDYTGTFLSNGWVYAGTTDITSKSESVTLNVKNTKDNDDTELLIRKKDKDSNNYISGAKFKVLVKLAQDKTIGGTTFKKDSYAWIKDQTGGLTTDATQALELQTDDSGNALVQKIPYGTYYVYETQVAQGYTLDKQEGYNSGKPSDYTGTFLSNVWVYVGTVNISAASESVTLEAKNIKDGNDGELTIRKTDKESGSNISGVKFKVLVKLEKDQTVDNTTFKKDSYVWIKNQNGGLTADASNALEFQTDSNGAISIKKLPYGKYYFYETQSIDGYTMGNQEGYNSGKPSDYTGVFLNGEWVYAGTATITSTTKSITINAKNIKDGNDGELVIRKSDKSSNGNISGAKFKVLVKLEQNIKIGNTTFKKDSYAWIKNQNGELTTDVSQALEVQTDGNGKVSIKKLPYGKYYVYETQSIDGYTMENQEGYNSGKPSDYTGTFLNGNWVYVGTTTISSTLKSVTLEAKNAKDGNDGELSIKKSDKNSNGNISGAKFKILVKLQQNRKIGDTTFKKDSYAWVKNQNGELTTDVTQALELQTNDGLAVVGKLSYGSYYVYETAAADGYTLESQDGYKTGKPSDYTGTFLSDEWVYVGTTTISSTSKSIALNVKNLKTSIKIIKKDEKKRQIVNNSNYYLGGAKIKIYGTNLADNTSGWLKQNGKKYEYTNYENATTFTTDSQTGEINIQGIKKGSYYIYEIGAPEGYILNRQDGYKVAQKGSSEIKDADWVYLRTTTVSTENNQVEASVENNKYIDIKGKVWVDKPDADKASSAKYNNIYDNQDILLSNITVKLIDNNTNNVIATTITNQSGEYTFSRKNNNEKINYWEAQSYHIEFTYDNKQYITVQPFIGDNNVNSKAQEWEINNDELDDEKLTGEGVAVTYKGNNYNNSNNKQLTSYYNEGTGTIENINLGLIEKVQPDHVIGEEIEYVKITKGDCTFKYKYGDEAVIDGNDQKNQSSVMFENSSKSFTQAIYPTDIAYNVANGLDGNDPNAYKVYIVYKISIKNICSWNSEYLYKEKGLYLDALSVQYDSKYELSNVTWDDDENSSDFTLWQQQQGRVLFDIDSARKKKFNSNNEGIKPGETENVYVQFKVKNEALIQLTQMPGENKEISVATTVTDRAFHQYERKDMNWQNNNTYVHKSLYEIRENSSLSIRLKLADSRTVSGVIFEDSKDDTRPNERVGDGKYSDGENKLSDVLVSLMEVKDDGTESLAYLYDGNLSYDANSGKWKANKKYAQVLVTESQAGTYQFNGIVPGRYYLKFTYGDGTTEIKNIDGSTTTANLGTKSNGQKIDSSKYKSTIITGAAKDTSNEYWYLNQDKAANYSVATDKEDVIRSRTTSTSEIKNATTSAGILIEASSPKMNVKFEYVTRDESNYNDKDQLYGDCSGMSFGIIERPRVDIQLEKNVKSVKYTLSNGTTLINGDSNNSPYIARVDDSYVKLELKESYIYGSQAEVKYELKIKNNSEIDYATSNYYKYGTTNSGDTPVTTTVTKIIDYLDNNGCNYANIDEKLQKSESDSDFEGGKETYFTEEAINYNKKYKSQLLKVQEKDLIPMEADTTRDKSKSTETYVMAINKLLSDRDKYGWESTSEIIGIKNVTNTSQYECTMGNYKVGDTVSKENGGTNEPDNGNGIISISEPTGSDKSYTKYICGGTMIIILGIGIICIKKFVL